MNLDFLVKNVKYYCDAKGVSMTAACVASGLSRTYLTDIKHSKSASPGLSSLCALADYFGITVSELLSETGPPPSQKLDLTVQEQDLIAAYRAANDQARDMVDFALAPFIGKKNARDTAG